MAGSTRLFSDSAVCWAGGSGCGRADERLEDAMRVMITGGTGLIGRSHAARLASQGYEVVVLRRDPARAPALFRQQGLSAIQTAGWDGRTAQGWGELLSKECVLVNL